MKKKRFTEERIVSILRDAEAKTIDAAADSMVYQNNPFIDGNGNLGRWRCRRYGNSPSFGTRMPV
jgi:hypothetical protein